MKQVCILGSTGTIGCNTLNVIEQNKEAYSVYALAANSNVDKLWLQCQTFEPIYAILSDPDAAQRLQQKVSQYGLATTVLCGLNALEQIVSLPEVDMVMAAIVGAVGMRSTLAAALAGKHILLANKEALVMAGELLMQAVADSGASLLPVDSEHNAIFQSMPAGYRCGQTPAGVNHITLTASGGPFRHHSLSDLHEVTPEEACAHPNWSMGQKISVDCATMVNKGLEVIEAHWLFRQPPSQIKVLLHPQSIIHSLVQYQDGSVLAQLGTPDMRTPIASAMSWPNRITTSVKALDLIECARLDFAEVDRRCFPSLDLAFDALTIGGQASAIFNASNEVAVAAFLNREIRFTDIHVINEKVLSHAKLSDDKSLAAIVAADEQARHLATEYAASISSL